MSEFDFSSLKQNNQDKPQNTVETKKEFDFSSLKNPNKNITENFENTVDVDSNRQNEVAKIASEIGQDVDYVNSNFEQIKKLKDTVPTDKELNEIKETPNTYDLMKNKEDVALIKDDYKNLSKFEKVLKGLVSPKSKFNPINTLLPANFLATNENTQKFAKTVGRAFVGGGIDLLSGLTRGTISVGARIPELVFSDRTITKYDKEQGKFVNIPVKPEYEFNLGKEDEELKRYIQQEATNLRNKANVLNEVIKEQTEKFLKDTGLAKTDKDGFVYDLAQGFSSLLASIGITALSGGVGAGGLAFGLYQFQNVYEEAKQKGKDELNSLVAGITSGSFEAGLESLGLHMFIEGLKVKKVWTKFLKGFGVESIQEGSQQFFEELITNLFGIREESRAEILGTVGYSALIGGLVGSSVSLAHSGIEKFSQKQQENRALEIVNKAVKLEQTDMVANNLKAVGEVAKQVKTVTRNPQMAEKFVEKTVGKDTPVFVSANALNEVLNQENEIKEKVLQQLGISNREQNVSADTDSNIKIPLAKWMIVAQGIKLSNGTTLFDSMLNDTKLDESGYTLKEKQDAINEINRIKTELEKDIEKQNQVLETADKQTRQKVETFFNTILDEAQPETMNDKKWKSDKQNAIKLWTAQALVNMQKRNINFDEWYEQNKNLRFVNELSEGRRNIKNRAVEAVQNIKDNNNEETNFYAMPTEKFVAEYEKLTNTKLNLDKKGKIQFHKDSIREAIRQGATVDEKILKDLDINPEYVDKRKFEDRNSNEQMLNHENEIKEKIFKVKEDEKDRFGKDVVKLLKDKRKKDDDTAYVGEIPFLYKVLGIEDGSVFIEKGNIKKDLGKIKKYKNHNVDIKEIQNIPQLYTDPIIVMKSLTEKNALVAVLNATDKSGRQIVLAIHPNKYGVGLHAIPSAYGKDDILKLIGETDKANGIIYVENKSSSPASWLLSPISNLRSNNNILQKSDIVKKYFEKERLEQAAYHGTPHRFDTFSTDKIGTGEGAQAHGWGLYFAGEKRVSERYRKGLARNTLEVFENGKLVDDDVRKFFRGYIDLQKSGINKTVEEYIKEQIDLYKDWNKNDEKWLPVYQSIIDKLTANENTTINNIVLTEDEKSMFDLAIEDIEQNAMLDGEYEEYEKQKNTHDTAINVSEYINSEFLEKTKQEIQERNDLISKLEKIDANKITIDENKGQLFQVEIPENDVLLDEQKTFDEQPKKVQEALKEIAEKELEKDVQTDFLKGYEYETKYKEEHPETKDFNLSVEINRLARFGKERTIELIKRYSYNEERQAKIDFINSIKNIDDFIVSNKPIDFKNYKGEDLTGKEIYDAITFNLKGKDADRKEASLLLNKYGIKGITYDGRWDGKAYVVFDDKAVKVLETYYQDNLFVDTKKATNKIVRGFIVGDEIHVTPASDISTYIHEMGHYWLRDLQNYVLNGQATDEVLKEWDTIKTWLNITDDTKHLTREQQETYARGLETYMMEGKAPSISLRNIFRKISNLMKYIYKRLTFEKVELSRDVHDYFDRLFATEQEIAENLASMETDFNKFMQKQNEKLKQEYENVKQEAHQQAVEILVEETMKEKTEKYKQDIETKKQEFYDNAKKEVEENKLYIATQKAIKDTKLSADKLIKKHKENSFSQDEIVSLMNIVADNNLSSIDELIQNVEYFKEPQKVIDEIVNGLMQEYENKVNDPEFIRERAIEAVNNEKQIELLALEREMLIYNFYKQDINKETAYTRSRQYKELVKEQVKNYLESMPINEAKRYYKYVQAQQRLNRQFSSALQKGDIQQAIQLKEKIVLNSELIRQSLQLGKEFEKKSKNIESFCEKKFYQNDNLVQVFNILNRFNLEHKQQKGYPIQSVPTLLEYQTAKNQYQNIDGQTATCEMLNLPEYLLNEENTATNLDDLTITQLRDVLTGLKQILHFDRMQQEMTVNGKKVEFETIVRELDEVARKNIDLRTQEKNSKEINKSLGAGWYHLWGKVRIPYNVRALRQGIYNLIISTGIKLDTLVHKLDGKDSYGNNKDITFYNVFLEPAKRASDKENKMLKHIIEQYQNLIKFYDKNDWYKIIYPAENTKIYVGELGNSFAKQELICMLLNFGNESSRQRLLETPVFDYRGDRDNWNEQTLMNVFQKYLDEKDYSFVQGVWNILEELGQTSFENHKELTGTYPQRVKEIPFTLYKDGKGFNFKGGYYPLKCDKRYSAKVKDRDKTLAEQLQEIAQTFFRLPSTDKGYTMTRTNVKYPISLEFAVFHQAVANQVHDVCFRKLIYDQNRLLSNPQLRVTIEECLGREGYEQFRSQVRVYGTRENFVGEREGFEKILNWFRMGVGSSMLAFKPGIIIQNLGNFFIYKNAIDNFGNAQVKKVWLKSLELNRHLVFNTQKGKAIKEFICSKSQMMTDRYDNFNYTMKECEQNMFEEKGRLAKLGNWLMVTSDNLSAVPAWIVAYEQGINELQLTDKQASDRADLLITRVVGSSRKMDQAQFTRSTNVVAKLFNPFASFMLNELNRWNTEFNVFVKEKDFARFAGFVVTRAFFAVISEVLSGRLPDFDDDDDNLTSWFKFIVKDILGYGLSMIPYLRTFYNGIDDILVGEKGFIGTKGQSSVLSNINTGAVVPVNETIKTFRDIIAGDIKEGQLQAYTEKMIDAVLVDIHQPLIFNDWLFNAYDVFVNGMTPEFGDIFKRRPKKKRK